MILIIGVGAGVVLGYFLGKRSGVERTAGGVEAEAAPVIGRVGPGIPGQAGPGERAGGVLEPSGDADHDEKEAYVERVAGDDPERAIAWVKANAEAGDRDDLYRVIAERWAKRDGAGAFQWAEGLQRSDERGDAYRGVIRGVMEAGDEATAMALIERIPVGSFRDGAMLEAISMIAQTDARRALETSKGLIDSYAFQKAGQQIGEQMIEAGRLEEAKAMVLELPYGQFQQKVAYGLVAAMAEEDPRQALSWISEVSESVGGGMDQSMAYRVAREFVEEDPLEAIAWGDKVPEGRARDYYYQTVGDAWARMEPDIAGDWLVKAIDGEGFDSVEKLARGVFDEWVERNQEQPFEFIERIRDAGERDRAMGIAMRELVGENPAVAAARLSDWRTVDEKEAKELTQRLMGSWMQSDPTAASQWVNTLEPGLAKDSAISTMVQNVIRTDKDYEGARAWVSEVESESLRGSLSRQIEAREDPEAYREKMRAGKESKATKTQVIQGQTFRIEMGAGGGAVIVR